MELSVAVVVSESEDGAHAMEKAATNKIPVNMAKSLTSESPYPGRAETTYTGALVEVTVVTDVLERQHAGLVQRDVGNRLARRIEFELWFVFLVGIIDYDEQV